MVIRQLVNRCIETLHSVQDIPRLYRKTNREAPTKPSTCIIATFRHLKTFSDEFSGTILTYDECHKFLKLAIDDITKKYYDLCSDILSSVRKMEDSILLLKRVRETSSVKTSLVQNNPSVTVSDDNKIRMQITNDINAFTNELEKLGITSDSSNKLTLLITEEGRLQA
ncbi:unnamed protein product [Didymodactylos carnosus]|nr:unnamed protein product [Didymodactylos carnosus]CAF4458249.1 unnamed protein product [Didymodactylos carnosus]